MNMTKYQIPFYVEDGSIVDDYSVSRYKTGPDGHTLMNPDGRGAVRKEIIYKDNIPFEDTLIIDEYYSGRSSPIIVVKSESTGATYVMAFSKFFDMAVNGDIVGKRIHGTWFFRKRGPALRIEKV